MFFYTGHLQDLKWNLRWCLSWALKSSVTGIQAIAESSSTGTLAGNCVWQAQWCCPSQKVKFVQEIELSKSHGLKTTLNFSTLHGMHIIQAFHLSLVT